MATTKTIDYNYKIRILMYVHTSTFQCTVHKRMVINVKTKYKKQAYNYGTVDQSHLMVAYIHRFVYMNS